MRCVCRHHWAGATGPAPTTGDARAGIKGERESAYFLDFHFKNSKNSVLIHDLRIEHNGRVAQIDHLLLTRIMDFYVIETKHFSDGLKIDENEQFLRWNGATLASIEARFEQRCTGSTSVLHGKLRWSR